MKLPGLRMRSVLLMAALLGIPGCGPKAERGAEERGSAAYLQLGTELLDARKMIAAVEAIEKAVEVDPRNAPLRFEVAGLYEQRITNWAAAIYHYERFLALDPQTDRREAVLRSIRACQLGLVHAVAPPAAPPSSGPADSSKLIAENMLLRKQVEMMEGVLVRRTTNRIAGRSALENTYALRRGDTLASVAVKFNVPLDALQAANTNVDPKRVRIGQLLVIPKQ